MRVAVLYDVHGNLPALEAALAEVRRDMAHAFADASFGSDTAQSPPNRRLPPTAGRAIMSRRG
jgi:hypothetical protein